MTNLGVHVIFKSLYFITGYSSICYSGRVGDFCLFFFSFCNVICSQMYIFLYFHEILVNCYFVDVYICHLSHLNVVFGKCFDDRYWCYELLPLAEGKLHPFLLYMYNNICYNYFHLS